MDDRPTDKLLECEYELISSDSGIDVKISTSSANTSNDSQGMGQPLSPVFSHSDALECNVGPIYTSETHPDNRTGTTSFQTEQSLLHTEPAHVTEPLRTSNFEKEGIGQRQYTPVTDSSKLSSENPIGLSSSDFSTPSRNDSENFKNTFNSWESPIPASLDFISNELADPAKESPRPVSPGTPVLDELPVQKQPQWNNVDSKLVEGLQSLRIGEDPISTGSKESPIPNDLQEFNLKYVSPTSTVRPVGQPYDKHDKLSHNLHDTMSMFNDLKVSSLDDMQDIPLCSPDRTPTKDSPHTSLVFDSPRSSSLLEMKNSSGNPMTDTRYTGTPPVSCRAWEETAPPRTPPIKLADRHIVEGSFYGQALHNDGSLLPILFQVRFHLSCNIEYLIGQKFVGQNCRNFGLVSKILSNEKFCLSKILSNEFLLD